MSEHEINTEKRHLSHLPWSPFLAGAMTGISDSTNLSLVLELMPHGDFHDLIDRFGPLTPLTACFYFCNLVCAIGFIHSHGLVSRDIKPANFLVGPDGYLVMTDLGIAERVRAGGPWQDMGTIEYMAPELIQQGYTVGTAVDWWSSGVVLYEMLTQTMVRLSVIPTQLYPREGSAIIVVFEGAGSNTGLLRRFLGLSHSRETVISPCTTTF